MAEDQLLPSHHRRDRSSWGSATQNPTVRIVRMVSDSQPPRRTQRQRTEATRAVIMHAAKDVLNEDGFARATTVSVQERANVSRGRLLHQFPSREELLIAAVKYLAEQQFNAMMKVEVPVASDAERIKFAIERLWALYDGPLFWAGMELWMASRTHPSLKRRFAREDRKMSRIMNDLADHLFGPDLVQRPRYLAFRHALIGSIRGVAITYSFARGRTAKDPHLLYWQDMAQCMLADTPTPEEPV